MAGRTPVRPGEIGSVHVGPAGERFRGRARTRDAGGMLHRLSATADTLEAVRLQLERKAAELAFTVNRIVGHARRFPVVYEDLPATSCVEHLDLCICTLLASRHPRITDSRRHALEDTTGLRLVPNGASV